MVIVLKINKEKNIQSNIRKCLVVDININI